MIAINIKTVFATAGLLRESLQSQVLELLRSTYAESTQATYRTHLRSYSAFCQALQVPLVPAQPQIVALYAALLSRSIRYTSVSQYLNIISLLHKSLELQSPVDNFLVKSVLRGIKNTIGYQPTIKMPITPRILYKILENLDLSTIVDSCVWQACLIMFFGLLRKSNLVGQHKVLRQECVLKTDSIELVIRSSKTRKKFVGAPRILSLPRFPGHPLCPVSAIVNYITKTSNCPLSSPLCSIPIGSGKYKCLDHKNIVNVVRKSVTPDEAASLSCHSFRRGGASFMYEIGMSTESIRLHGDWVSDCYKRYIITDSAVLSRKSVQSMQQGLLTMI